MKKLINIVLLATAVTSLELSAHHSVDSRYLRNEISEITGTVKELRWGNPHTFVILEGNDGREWTLEGVGGHYLLQFGATKDMFAEGKMITVAGLASRFDLPELYMGNLLLPDGQEILLAGGAKLRWTNGED